MDVRAEKHGRPHQKVRFFCGPGDGEKLFDPGASGRKGQECPREIRTKKFVFMLFFSSLTIFTYERPLASSVGGRRGRGGGAWGHLLGGKRLGAWSGL